MKQLVVDLAISGLVAFYLMAFGFGLFWFIWRPIRNWIASKRGQPAR